MKVGYRASPELANNNRDYQKLKAEADRQLNKQSEEVKAAEKEQPNHLQLENVSRVNTSNFLDQTDLANLASIAKQGKYDWRNLPGTDASVTIPSSVATTEDYTDIATISTN